MNHTGWFMSYAFRYVGTDELNIGGVTWRNYNYDTETPWQKISRWNKQDEEKSYVLLSWKKLTEDEFFEYDSET